MDVNERVAVIGGALALAATTGLVLRPRSPAVEAPVLPFRSIERVKAPEPPRSARVERAPDFDPEIALRGRIAVGWHDGFAAMRGLPAISDDGSLVVTARQDGDGGRGAPNLTL